MEGGQEKINFNGLTGVPTGPKLPSTRGQNDPHIFIPAKALAPMPTTRKHLAKFLRIGEENIQCDNLGWCIVFEDSAQGLQSLEKCYAEFHLQKLFSQYVLNMQRFPNGSRLEASKAGCPSESAIPPRQELGRPGVDGGGQPSETESMSTVSPLPRVHDSMTKPPAPAKGTDMRNTRPSVPMSAPLPANANGVPASRLSPTATRADKDDSSSVSALSSSDASGSKGSKCHVCRTPPLSGETLVYCTTCPRKYHRRCSPKETVPTDPYKLSSWQCQRCIKKQIPPRSRLSTSSLPSDLPEPLATKPKDGEKHGSSASPNSRNVAAFNQNTEMTTPIIGPSRASTELKSTFGRSEEADTADSLVEDAFASSAINGAQTKKTGRLNLIRKKILPPMSAPDESQREDEANTPSEDRSLGGRGEKRTLDEDDGARMMRKAQKLTAAVDTNNIHGNSEQAPHQEKQVSQPQDQGNAERQSASSATPALAAESTTAPNPGKISAKLSGPAGKRNKLQTVPMGECARCQKPIALHPSGKNIHCVKCKKELAASIDVSNSPGSPVPSRDDSPLTTNKRPRPSGQSGDAPEDAAREDVALVEDEAANDFQQADGGSRKTAGGTPSPDSGRLKKIDQRTACESCKTHHKRCVHGIGREEDVQDLALPLKEEDIWAIHQTPTKRSIKRPGIPQEAESASRIETDSETDGPVKNIKRKSFRSRPKDEYDLGSSEVRPKGTYEKLIGMALCSTEKCRMSSGEIVRWINENIPNYQTRDSNGWEAGIRATIVMRKYRPLNDAKRCANPLWYTEMIDPLNKSKGSNVELMENLEEKMLHWDPVLKIPRSPVKLDRPPEAPAADQDAKRLIGALDSQQQSEDDDARTSEGLVNARLLVRLKKPKARTSTLRDGRVRPDDEDVKMEDVESRIARIVDKPGQRATQQAALESSDDEPLLQRSRPSFAEPSSDDLPMSMLKKRSATASQSTAKRNDSKVDTASPDALDATAEEANQASALSENSSTTSSPRTPFWNAVLEPSKPRTKVTLSNPKVEGVSLAEAIKRESETVDYGARSLFEEWPEYTMPFDRSTKSAELEARPRRKQRFRALLSRNPRTGQRSAYGFEASVDDSRRSSVSFDRLTRTPNKAQRTFDIWQSEDVETGVTKCDTWEQFFELPANPIPIMHDGQLAYRERTQDEFGGLRRAKVIYKTGYA